MRRVVCIVLLVVIICCFSSCIFEKSLLQNKEYNTIEELHSDFVAEYKKISEPGYDYWPDKMITYVQIEDRYFVFCTYTTDKDKKSSSESISAYVVRKQGSKYVLDTGELGREIVQINISDPIVPYNGYYVIDISVCTINGKKQDVGFVYKNHLESGTYYLDGIKMTEINMIHPDTEENMVICYAVVQRKTGLYRIFGDHKLEFKQD